MTENYDREYIFELESQLSAVIYLFQKLFSSEEFNRTDFDDINKINDLHTCIEMNFKTLREIDFNLQKYVKSLYTQK